MLSSRITLSFAAYGLGQAVSLAWLFDRGPGSVSYVHEKPVSALYVWGALAAFFFFCWLVTFVRAAGPQYFFPSRLLLSFLAALLGVLSTMILIDSGVTGGIDLKALSQVKLFIFVGAVASLAVIWLTIYFRTRRLHKLRERA